MSLSVAYWRPLVLQDIEADRALLSAAHSFIQLTLADDTLGSGVSAPSHRRTVHLGDKLHLNGLEWVTVRNDNVDLVISALVWRVPLLSAASVTMN